MSTYCRSEDLVLDTGKQIDDYFDVSLTENEKKRLKEDSRVRVYQMINDIYLFGKTAIPALHIPALKNIEKDLVIADLLAAAYTQSASNVSEWENRYRERANESLQNIRYVSSSDDVSPDSANTGDGYVSEIITNDEFTMTELWTLEASDSGDFVVHGSLHGRLRDLQVGTEYPEKDWTGWVSDYGLEVKALLRYEEYPIRLTITAGDTAFVDKDRFTFKTYSASFFRQRDGRIMRG